MAQDSLPQDRKPSPESHLALWNTVLMCEQTLERIVTDFQLQGRLCLSNSILGLNLELTSIDFQG